MAARNPIRNAFKHGTNARTVKEESRKVTEELKKEARAVAVRRKRNIAIEEVPEQQGDGKTTCLGRRVDKRKEQMLAWKAGRDKQRKIEAIKNKKDHGFVVKHVLHSPAKFLVAESAKNGVKMESKQQADKPSRRITRSCTKHMRKIQNERKMDKKKTTSKMPVPIASNGASPRSEERRPSKNQTKKEGNNNDSSDVGNATRSTTEGFDFQFNSQSIILKTFNFCTETPVFKFSHTQVDFEDPVEKFSASGENDSNASSMQAGTGLERSQMEIVNPTAKFNTPLRAVNEATKTEKNPVLHCKKESLIGTVGPDKLAQNLTGNSGVALQETSTGSSATVMQSAIAEVPSNIALDPKDDIFKATRSLRCTPRRAAGQMEQSGSNVKKEQAKEVKIRNEGNMEEDDEVNMAAKGCPGKTPKRHRALPKHMVELMDEERFTPRRIQSTSHFRRLVAGEREKLNNQNAVWTTYLNENELKEEICGRVRTVIGQAQLLMDQRFKQFEDLITLHQSNISEYGATATDLQGFWDMVDYQIADVHKKFAELETWKNKNWEIEKPKKTAKVRKVVDIKTKDTSKATAARQEATRKFKQAMKAKLQAAKSGSDADLGVQIAGGTESVDQNSITSKATALPVIEDDKLDYRFRSSSGDMSSDSLKGEKCRIKMSPLKNNSSFNSQLCTALEKIDLKNTEENKELEGKENISSPLKRSTLRRSMRKTPSKFKTPKKQDDSSTNVADKKPEDIACNLFMNSANMSEDDGLFAKYLRPSVAEEEYDDLFGLGVSSLIKGERRTSQQRQDISLIKFD